MAAKVYQVGIDVDVGPHFRDAGKTRIDWKERARAGLLEAQRAIKADPQHLILALTAADIERAKRLGKVAILLGVEGGKLLEGDLANLRLFHRLGLRELQLRWAVPNQIVERDTLTDFGRAVVKECQRLGVIVDLTHIPAPAFDQVVGLASKPLIVSHGTGRELGEARLKALRRLGGVVGIHFYSSYLGDRPGVAQVLDAVDFVAARAGAETVALGVDFFPKEGQWAGFERAQGTKDIIWAIPDLSHPGEVTCGLVARGSTDRLVAGLPGKKFLRVCTAVFKR